MLAADIVIAVWDYHFSFCCPCILSKSTCRNTRISNDFLALLVLVMETRAKAVIVVHLNSQSVLNAIQ